MGLYNLGSESVQLGYGNLWPLIGITRKRSSPMCKTSTVLARDGNNLLSAWAHVT
jgi:hypothetical protein